MKRVIGLLELKLGSNIEILYFLKAVFILLALDS